MAYESHPGNTVPASERAAPARMAQVAPPRVPRKDAGLLDLQGPLSACEPVMDGIVLCLRQCTSGWRIFQGPDPLFWFPGYDEALASARMIAAVHVDLRAVAAVIEVQLQGEPAVQVAALSPPH